ncbi:MAG: HDOD domain-containing protein [Phycisphaerales bacterium]|nr:HDOD domain-containing protein [Phycisphaerales bacterium]
MLIQSGADKTMANSKAILSQRLGEFRLQGINPVVMSRLVELSSHPTVDPESYRDLAQVEPMLASRLLGVANSSWASPLKPVTHLDHAINMLGLANVRALSLAFCLERFHASLELDVQDTRALWEASLLKATAGRALAEAVRPDWTEEPFIAGLLQDLGVPLMMSISPEYRKLLADSKIGIEDQLTQERAIFGVDHVTVGSVIAYKLGLPTRYLTSILRHHTLPSHSTDDPTVSAEWIDCLVALLPHMGSNWNLGNMGRMESILSRFWQTNWADLPAFLKDITSQCTELAGRLGRDISAVADLEKMLDKLARANTQAVVDMVQQSLRNGTDPR